MLNSKEILEQTGISRATLNNYIGWGIVPKPEVLPPEPQDGGAPRIGYFPEDVVARIADIQRLKKEGWSMPRIAEHYGAPLPTSPPVEDVSGPDNPAAEARTGTAALGPRLAGAAQPSAAGPHAKRSPVLTHVAVLVAGLQHSPSIWAELPAEDYFELINQVWATVDPIFRLHSASHGKHPADGMVGYFFPVPGANYLWNALLAAHDIRDAMRRVSKDWQLRKGWSTDLYMNIGIDEGQEWLGTFRSSSTVEFAAFAETINQAALISDFSRSGAVWVTKNLVGKLPAEEQQRLRYGVRRKTSDGQHVFVPSIFSDVQRVAHTAAGTDQRRELPLLPVTEIIEMPVGRAIERPRP